MNKIRQIQELNKRELEAGIPPNASWHTDYRDTAYIYIGGLPHELSEGDIITIFSQYGEPTYINLVRDKETGKSRGFGFLKYEDQRSTDLAVDNLSGMVIAGRTISVDHTRYKLRDDGEDPGIHLTQDAEDAGAEKSGRKVGGESDTEVEEEKKPRRSMLKEEKELEALKRDHDEDDPMREYLIKEKEEELSLALAKIEKKSGHKSNRRPRSKRDGEDHERRSKRRDRSRDDRRERHGRPKRRSRSRDKDERSKKRDRSAEPKGFDRHPKRSSPERASRRGRSTEERSDDDGRTRRGGERNRRYSEDRDDEKPRKSRHEHPGRSHRD